MCAKACRPRVGVWATEIEGAFVVCRAPLMRWIAVLIASLLVAGCVGMIDARAPLPQDLVDSARVPGLDGIRAWGDEVPEDLIKELNRRFPNVKRIGRFASRQDGRPIIEVLALSGGGPNGAFGAGLLSGWTKSGRRPEFEIVTGVSAGALIAPFAFLGPEYDDTLREIWTTYETNQLVKPSGLPGLLGGDSLVDTTPLAELIARYLNRKVLDEIAREYRRGRLLMVLTTNLDAQRPVVWNMGELAARRTPAATDLFHKVVLASAAIPGIFPPVRVTVEADGKTFDELHVDGGVTRQLFVTPVEAPISEFNRLYETPPIHRIYVIENGKPAPIYAPVEQKTLPLVGQSIISLLRAQASAELYQVFRRVRDANADFFYAAIPVQFPFRPAEAFDKRYQKKLYEAGEAQGRSRQPWARIPPQLVPTARRPKPVATRPVGPRRSGAAVSSGSNFFSALSGSDK